MGSEGQASHCLKINHGQGLAVTGLSLLLEGAVSVPSSGGFALGTFCLSKERSWKSIGKYRIDQLEIN